MIDYRPATLADGPALDAMARRVWLATFAGTAPEADLQAYVAKAYGPGGTLLRHLADPAYTFQLAADGDAVAGYCKLGPTFFTDEVPTEGTTHLHQLYVEPAHHGAGIAAVLMDWATAQARAAGSRALLLTVFEDNHRALRFYRKHGFEHIGDYAFQTGSQVDRDLIMRLAL